jgi:hypothetical protein
VCTFLSKQCRNYVKCIILLEITAITLCDESSTFESRKNKTYFEISLPETFVQFKLKHILSKSTIIIAILNNSEHEYYIAFTLFLISKKKSVDLVFVLYTHTQWYVIHRKNKYKCIFYVFALVFIIDPNYEFINYANHKFA